MFCCVCVRSRLYGSKKHCILLGMQKITIKRLAQHADKLGTDCTSLLNCVAVGVAMCVCVCVYWLCKNAHTLTNTHTHVLMHGLTQEAPHSSSSFIRLLLMLLRSVWPKIFGINAINSLFSNGKLTAKCSRQPQPDDWWCYPRQQFP